MVDSLVDVLVTTYEVSWSCMLRAPDLFLKESSRLALLAQDGHLEPLFGLVE